MLSSSSALMLEQRKKKKPRLGACLAIGAIVMYALSLSFAMFVTLEHGSRDHVHIQQRALQDEFFSPSFSRTGKWQKTFSTHVNREKNAQFHIEVGQEDHGKDPKLETMLADKDIHRDDSNFASSNESSLSRPQESQLEDQLNARQHVEPNRNQNGHDERHPIISSLQKGLSNGDQRIEEESVQSTEDDPDGLKQKLAIRWEKAQCDYGSELAPPTIQLDNPLIEPMQAGTKSRFTGVLIDAARHFFPLSWLYGLVDFLAVLGYDMIQFRLTDDQSFAVQLDSHPDLARAAHYNRTHEFYTAQQLRDFVVYAKSRGISIMPEVNVPGHAGGWAGIPGMVYPCAKFICSHSYSIPMRIDNPTVLQVIEDVLREVLDIFDNPPYLHLGGDETWMSDPCFTELQIRPDYQKFEDALMQMLSRLDFSPARVVRWETTSGEDSSIARIVRLNIPLRRAGEITHWWRQVPTAEGDLNRSLFISTDLYFDASLDKDAWDVAKIAADRYAIYPSAVIAATFELGPCSFKIRNVWGKLIAVAMATRQDMPKERQEFLDKYHNICLGIGLPLSICDLEGRPSKPTYLWKLDHNILKNAWSATICHRLTFPARAFGMKWKDLSNNVPLTQYLIPRAEGLRKEIAEAEASNPFVLVQDSIYQFSNHHMGVMIDLTHQFFPMQYLRRIIDFVSTLGFNLLHIRLIENDYFPIKLLEYDELSQRSKPYKESYTEDQLRQLVRYAGSKGVRIMPEINVFNNAGGWLKSGLLVSCPKHICDVGGSIPMDVNKARALSLVSVVSGIIMQIFATAPFLHLGSVDAEKVEPCYREAYPHGEIDVRKYFYDFAEALQNVHDVMGVNRTRIATWDSPIQRLHGGVVHYSKGKPVNDASRRFLVTVDVNPQGPWDESPWHLYQQTRQLRNQQAIGVVVGTKGWDADDWESTNVFGRLIAVAAALSNRAEMDEESFNSHYSATCTNAGIPLARCYSYGAPVSSSSELVTAVKLSSMCSKFTTDEVARFPKKQ